MTTCLTHDQINDKRKMPLLSGETFLKSGKLFKINFQSRSLNTCAFRGLLTSQVTWHTTGERRYRNATKNGSKMTTWLTHDQINDKRQIPILSGETFLENGKLFRRNFQSRNLDTCAASSTRCPNFRVCLHQKSRDTTREIYNPKG